MKADCDCRKECAAATNAAQRTAIAAIPLRITQTPGPRNPIISLCHKNAKDFTSLSSHVFQLVSSVPITHDDSNFTDFSSRFDRWFVIHENNHVDCFSDQLLL